MHMCMMWDEFGLDAHFKHTKCVRKTKAMKNVDKFDAVFVWNMYILLEMLLHLSFKHWLIGNIAFF